MRKQPGLRAEGGRQPKRDETEAAKRLAWKPKGMRCGSQKKRGCSQKIGVEAERNAVWKPNKMRCAAKRLAWKSKGMRRVGDWTEAAVRSRRNGMR